jgi:hypothetical protein
MISAINSSPRDVIGATFSTTRHSPSNLSNTRDRGGVQLDGGWDLVPIDSPQVMSRQ